MYAAVKIHTTMTLGSLGFKKGLIIHDAWEQFVNKKVLPFINKVMYFQVLVMKEEDLEWVGGGKNITGQFSVLSFVI